MTYTRVIPRDLFNEANMLKCLGQLYLELERYFPSDKHPLQFDEDYFPGFALEQDNDGNLFPLNISLTLNGRDIILARPLNSRQPWPLYALDDNDRIPVFDDAGRLSREFKDWAKIGQNIPPRGPCSEGTCGEDH